MRNLLSIAITQIAKKTFTSDQVILGEVCPADNETLLESDEDIMFGANGTYDWSEAVQGVILSSFYWGYIITHIPGGMMVERLGGKITFFAGIAATSILTILTPGSIELGGSTLLIVNRVIMGLSQGFIYAAVFGLLASWIPLRERTTLGVFVLSGMQVIFKKFYTLDLVCHQFNILIFVRLDRFCQHICLVFFSSTLTDGLGHFTFTVSQG